MANIALGIYFFDKKNMFLGNIEPKYVDTDLKWGSGFQAEQNWCSINA